jgi:hypothetical protein
MNPAFLKLLRSKRKRPVDPNAPPRPTLLGQVKELRMTKEEQEKVALEVTVLRHRLEYVEAKNRRIESQLRDLENYVRNRIK